MTFEPLLFVGNSRAQSERDRPESRPDISSNHALDDGFSCIDADRVGGASSAPTAA